MPVDADVTTGPMNALIQQDAQFLQVDNMCDDGDVYLTTANGQPLTYIGKSYSLQNVCYLMFGSPKHTFEFYIFYDIFF